MLNPSCPTKKGQKFVANKETLTVKSFYGADGVEFDNYEAARDHNKTGHISVCNAEYGGASHENRCFLVQ